MKTVNLSHFIYFVIQNQNLSNSLSNIKCKFNIGRIVGILALISCENCHNFIFFMFFSKKS